MDVTGQDRPECQHPTRHPVHLTTTRPCGGKRPRSETSARGVGRRRSSRHSYLGHRLERKKEGIFNLGRGEDGQATSPRGWTRWGASGGRRRPRRTCRRRRAWTAGGSGCGRPASRPTREGMSWPSAAGGVSTDAVLPSPESESAAAAAAATAVERGKEGDRHGSVWLCANAVCERLKCKAKKHVC
jgi:hypothetical protein